MSSSSFSSFASMSGVQGAPVQSSSFIRLSPTSFFKSHSASSAPTLLATLMSTGAATKKDEVPLVSSPSPPNELLSTPKSHHRRQAPSRAHGQSAGAARKKLCYPEEGSNSRGAAPLPTQRNVCFIPKFVQKSGPSPTMKKAASQLECQSACVYDNFSSTNVYATPPRHSLRRQQSASATMMPVGNGRYRSNTAFVRFTPPIGEDVSALYAGSKFSDSPSAKSLPLPPAAWLEELALHTSALNLKAAQAAAADQMSSDESVKSLKNVAEEEEDGVTSDDTGVVFDLDDGKCSSPSAASDSSLQVVTTEEEGSDAGEITTHPKLVQMFGQQSKPEGIRLTPLQLIAAVATS